MYHIYSWDTNSKKIEPGLYFFKSKDRDSGHMARIGTLKHEHAQAPFREAEHMGWAGIQGPCRAVVEEMDHCLRVWPEENFIG